MAANAIDLCLAADVASDLGVSNDATVQRCVTAASRAAAVFCGRTFEKATGIVEYPASYRRPFLLVDRAPILSITSVYEGGVLLNSTSYESIGQNADAGLILRLSGGVWLSTEVDVGNVTEIREQDGGRTDTLGVKVTYTGGFVTPGQNSLDSVTYPTVSVPETVQEAARIAAGMYYRGRGVDPMAKSEAIGDWSVAYFDQKATSTEMLPPLSRALLLPYRFIRVV